MRALVRRTRFAGASPEGVTVPALNANVVAVALRLVRDFVQAGFVAAYALAFGLESRGGLCELFGALNLNHCLSSFRVG